MTTDHADGLGARLRERLRAAQAERDAAAASVERAMRERLEAEARSRAAAEPLYRNVIRPMCETLAGQFENATCEHVRLPRGFATHCRFAHTARFPATAKFSVALQWDEDGEHAWLVADRDVVPVLMPFDATDRLEIALPAPEEPAIRAWVEARIVAFVDAYLQIERNPSYQQGRTVTDPVCGMQVPRGLAAHTADYQGRSYHFCSAACQAEFAAEPARYVGAAAGPGASARGMEVGRE